MQIELTRQLKVETPHKKRSRMCELNYLTPFIERPIHHGLLAPRWNINGELPCGITGLFSEIYQLDSPTSAHYVGLRRMPTLSRTFNPARLPL